MLNQGVFRTAGILVGGPNFGCGSSREHAVWALHDRGIRCVIAPSFGEIFFNNCFRNGVLPVLLPEAEWHRVRTARASTGAPGHDRLGPAAHRTRQRAADRLRHHAGAPKRAPDRPGRHRRYPDTRWKGDPGLRTATDRIPPVVRG